MDTIKLCLENKDFMELGMLSMQNKVLSVDHIA